MNFFNRIASRAKQIFRNLSPSDEKAWSTAFWNLFGMKSTSGVNVTEETALTYSAVWSAVSQISATVATLPLHLLKASGRTKRKADTENLYYILGMKPNPFMTSMNYREVSMAHLLTWGNWYSEIVRNPYTGAIEQLWPITPNRVIPRIVDGALVYDISVGGETKRLDRFHMLHIPGLGFDGLVGYSVIAMAKNTIGLGMALETFGAELFKNGINPGAVLTHPDKLSPTSEKNLRDSLGQYEGLGHTHRLMLLEEGMKLEKISIPPNDSQFLESRQFQITEVARWYNIPVHKLKEMTKSSFNNIESENTSYATDTILPWLIRLEQNFDDQLLTESEQRRKHLYFKHNYEGLLRADTKSRAEYYNRMFNVGAMSQNDIREKEDMDPVEGGDEYFVPLNMIPVSKLDEYLENQQKNQQKTTQKSDENTDENTEKPNKSSEGKQKSSKNPRKSG